MLGRKQKNNLKVEVWSEWAEEDGPELGAQVTAFLSTSSFHQQVSSKDRISLDGVP